MMGGDRGERTRMNDGCDSEHKRKTYAKEDILHLMTAWHKLDRMMRAESA